jgi:hypothetical protein
MDPETNDLIARLYLSEKGLSHVETADLASWAASRITAGHETPAVRRLAQATGDIDAEADALFREAISEMGWEWPSKKSALKRHAESILPSIVDGSMDPYDGCSHLYIISIFLGHPDYLYNWNGLFWAREDLEVGELNELIIEEARQQLEGKPPTINESLPRYDEDDEAQPGFLARLKELVRWL